MKKIMITTLLSLSICTMFTGCTSLYDMFNSPVPPAKTVKLDASEYADLSEDLYSYEIKIDGVKYTLPVDYSELANNGWQLDAENSEQVIQPGLFCYDSIKLTKNDMEIRAQFMNAGTGASNKLPDCKVGEISVYTTDKTSIILPQGITIGSSMDDLKAAYGEPLKTKTYDKNSPEETKSHTYYDPDYGNDPLCSLIVNENPKTNKISSISISSLVY